MFNYGTSKDRTIGPFRFKYSLWESGKREVSVRLALPKRSMVDANPLGGDEGCLVGSRGAAFVRALQEEAAQGASHA